MVKAQEASSRDRVKGGQRRRQEWQPAARILYVLLRPGCQLLLPLPHDGFALCSALDTLHSKSTGREITPKSGVGGCSCSTNYPPLVTQQHQWAPSAVVGVERRRWEHAREVVLLAVVGQVPCFGA